MSNGKVPEFKKNIEFTDDGRLIIMDARLALQIAESFSKNGNLLVQIMSWGELGVSYKERKKSDGVSLGYKFSAVEHGKGNPNPAEDKNLGCGCDVHVNIECPSGT